MQELVNRLYIADKLGIKVNKLSELAHLKQIKLPFPAKKKGKFIYYNKNDADKFIASDPLKKENRFKNQNSPAARQPQLDNAMAIAFLTAPTKTGELSFEELRKKHCRKFGKTTIVHLQEIDIQVDIRADLMCYRNADPIVNLHGHNMGGFE